MILSSEFFGALSVALGVAAYAPYVRSIFYGATRPHMFSWTVWSLTSGIVFFAQSGAGAGAGAWTTGFEMLACGGLAVLAFFRGERHITRSDRISFVIALLTIPLWRLTHEPLIAVVLVCGIDLLGFYPTIRKSWNKPHEELVKTYVILVAKTALSLLALESWNWTTALYPVKLSVTIGGFILMVLLRRRALGKTATA